MRYKSLKVDKITLIFCAEWALYMIFEGVLGRFTNWRLFLMNLLPFVFFYLVAQGVKGMEKRIGRSLQMGVILGWAAVLVAGDQLAKLVVRTFIADGQQISLIADWLYLTPVLNVHGSFVTSRFDWNVGMIWMIAVNLLTLFFIVQGYRYYVQAKRKSFWASLTMTLFLAGGVASLIDKVFFGGSLDFLGLQGLFVADTKDFYLTIGLGCAVVELVDNPDNEAEDSGFKEELRSVWKFLRFCFGGKVLREEVSE